MFAGILLLLTPPVAPEPSFQITRGFQITRAAEPPQYVQHGTLIGPGPNPNYGPAVYGPFVPPPVFMPYTLTPSVYLRPRACYIGPDGRTYCR
jgi:hypothetical protein